MGIKKFFKLNKKGAALMYTMMFLLLLSVIVVSFSLISINMYKNTAVSANKTQSFMFAKAIGQAFALELTDELDANNIVSYLEKNTKYASTVKGNANVVFNTDDENKKTAINNAIKGTGLTAEDLSDINLVADLKFYFKTTCAYCGQTLEDLVDANNRPTEYCQSSLCKGLNHTDKITNKRYLYLDVTVSYHGATEVVTTVFTYLDNEDFVQTMHDLFSVYNIYSTYPSEMTFNFANPGQMEGSSIAPNVYLYNGIDSENDGYGTTTSDTYKVSTDIRANLTSTGDILITSDSATIRNVKGNITSYGSMTIERLNVNTIYIRNELNVLSSAKVTSSIYGRGDVNISGSSTSANTEMVGGTIYALGNVTVKNCVVNRIIGGAGCNVTLVNARCSSISTGGNVTITNSTVDGDIYCDGNLNVNGSNSRETAIKGKIETKGGLTVKKSAGLGDVTFGGGSSGKVIHVGKNATFTTTGGTGSIQMKGDVVIEGAINYSNSIRPTIINGNLHIKGSIPQTVSGETNQVTYLSALTVNGDVLISSGNGCIPLFGKDNGASNEAKTTINGLLTTYGSVVLGDGVQGVLSNEAEQSRVGYTFSDNVQRFINLNGAVIDSIYTAKQGDPNAVTQLFIKNGKINKSIQSEQIVVSGVTIDEKCKVNATGNDGCFIAVDNSKLYGQIVASATFSLHSGSVLYATQTGFVHVAGTGSHNAEAYVNGEVYGELVVGQASRKGTLVIQEKAVLGGNDIDKAIYINGDLKVMQHSASAITNNPEQFAPRLTTVNNNGNRIYLSDGTAYLNGWVYNLYIKNGELVMLDEISGCAPKPYIKGTTYIESDYVFIGKDGLKDSEGATYTNSNVIVYVYETPTKELGDMTISGTLVVRQGVTFKCKSLKVDRIMSEYGGSTLTASNSDALKQELKTAVESFDFNNNSKVTSFIVSGDAQINQFASGKITFENCEFKGWLKIKNVSGTVVFNNSEVTGETHTTYPNNQSDKYKGCLDVGNGSLSMKNSYVGGKDGVNNVNTSSSLFEGNVYVGKLFTMEGGQVYGTVYCEYADSLIDCKLSNGLTMTATSTKTATDWRPTFINKYIYGKNVRVQMTKGVLCGTSASSSVGSSNIESNLAFVYLKDLKMSGSAMVSEYTSVFIDGGSDSALSGKTIGNIYANTTKLNIFKSSAISSVYIAGLVNVKGTLTFSSGINPSAEKGLYASNKDDKISESDLVAKDIKGNVDLPNYTKSISLGKVTGYVYGPNATVKATNSIDGNIDVKTLNVNPTTSVAYSGTVYARESLYVSTDKYVDFNKTVKTSLLVVNVSLMSGSSIGMDTYLNNPQSVTLYKDASVRYVTFYEIVYVTVSSSGKGGRAFLSNCLFKNAVAGHNGSTLYADRAVYATRSDFYGAGYLSTVKHTFTSGIGNYNTSSSAYSSKFGSIVTGLRNDDSSTYGLYLYSVNCYSNISMGSNKSSYIGSSSLGQSTNSSGKSDVELRNYTKHYVFGGSLVLNATKIESIVSSDRSDVLGYTYVSTSGALTLQNNSYIGTSFSTPRVHAHTGFKGVYVGGNMSIASGCIVRLNIYCKGTLSNSGSIELNISKTISWRDTKGWGWTNDWQNMSSTYVCGGVIKAKSYSNRGYCSMQTGTSGWSMKKSNRWQEFTAKTNEGHNIPEGVLDEYKPEREKDYTFCNHNSGNLQTTSSADSYYLSLNATTSNISGLVSSGVSRNTPSVTNPTIGSFTGIVGLEWDSTESLEGKRKTPLTYLSVTTVTRVNVTEEDIVVKVFVDSYNLNTDNWLPQAIPLRWYRPTETTAGEPVSLTGYGSSGAYNNFMTVSEKKLGQSIDSLEACISDFKRFGNLSFWDWITGEALSIGKSLFNNAKNFFTNLPTLFTPSSSYVGLTFKNNEDAKYYRVSAKNISTVLSDTKGKDMLVITRRTMVVQNTFPSGDLLDALIKYVKWNPDWVLPTSFTLNQRPVGLVFFNSGIVPSSVFDTTYRKYSDYSKERDSSGRYYWGGSDGAWYGNMSAANDVTWTFFTCEDPTNPYGSPAKDLHIIIPANTKMVWSKDKDSCVNIIGNGRVFLYLQENTDIKVVGNGFSHWLHDKYMNNIDSWLSQWTGKDATYNVFGGVRYVQTTGSGLDEKTYYDASGNPVMDERAYRSGKYQLQPRMYIVGTGGNISFEVQDFQTAAYVYMPSGYSYGDTSARNVFKISSNSKGEGDGHWDVYGMYVCDNFQYLNGTSAKVNYVKTSPDLSNTVIKHTNIASIRAGQNNTRHTTSALQQNRSYYQLAEFWDYPTDLPVSSMNWYYRGLALS